MNTPKQPAEGSHITHEETSNKKLTAEELRSRMKAIRQAKIDLEIAKAEAFKNHIAFR